MDKINSRIFRDIDYATLDINKHKEFIIQRVLMYGSWNDFISLLQLYGANTIKKEVLSIKDLSQEVCNFLSFYFTIPRKKFPCYSNKPSPKI